MLSKAIPLGLLAAMLTLPTPASAETPAVDTSANVVVQVVIQTPPGFPRERIVEGFRKAVPQYAQVPGLVRKYFTITDTGFGGTYLFASRQAAESWFNPAWRQKATATYGSAPVVTYYDAPVQVDGRNPAGKP